MQRPKPTSGEVLFGGTDLTKLRGEELRKTRTRLQMIFQDPISSLNPRRRVRDIIAEPLKIWGVGSESDRKAQVDEVLEAVGIDPSVTGDKRPHEFSGGQSQRISLARALVLDRKLVSCDAPVSDLEL